jgi:hypothetical protein
MALYYRIGGVDFEYELVNGIHRFVKNDNHPMMLQYRNCNKDMNAMYARYFNGEFTKHQMMELYAAMGYSIGGFEELGLFENVLDNEFV